MNSEFGYRWIRKHKEMLKHGYTINVSHFAAEPIKGSGGKAIFTYDCPYLLSIIDVVTRVYTDNRRVIKEVVDRNAITPSKFKVHYQSERNLKLIKPKDRLVEDGKLNILWASRVVPIKLPDMVAEIGKLLEPDKFRINVFGEMSDEVNKHVFEEIPSIKYWGAYDGFASLPINENDILLYTSYSDGMPNVPLEAAAAGLPIIASNDGGVGEFVKNGKTGILIEDYLNPDAYIPALERALKNPSELLKYAKAAQKLLQEQHGWDKFVEMVKSDIG